MYDIIALFIFVFTIVAFLFFTMSRTKEETGESYEKCFKICKNDSYLVKISTVGSVEDTVCYCETSPGIIDEVKVENGR